MLKSKFIENFLSLTILRILTLIVPLVTYPYLIKILGSEKYGLVMWAWSIINFFILFINFGFDMSITKYISIYRNDNKKISEIVSTTLFIKNILLLVSFFVFLILINTIPKMMKNQELFFYTFMLTLGETMMPIWFFQGIEQMKYTAFITSFVKIFFTLLVFVLIAEPSDYYKVPLLYAISSIISAIFAYYIIIFKHKIKIVKPKLRDIFFYIKDTTPLFLSNSISILRENLIILFIEKYIGLSAVAYFDLAQKFINILITPFHIIATVLYPHVAKTKNFILLKKSVFYTTLLAITLYILVYSFNNQIISLLYGCDESKVIELILNILALMIIFGNISSFFGINGLIILSRNKELFLSSVFSFGFFLFSLFILAKFYTITLEFVSWIIVFSYIIESIIRGYFIKDILWQKK